MELAKANRDVIKMMLYPELRPLYAGQTVVVHKGDDLVNLDGDGWCIISPQGHINKTQKWKLDDSWITPYVLENRKV